MKLRGESVRLQGVPEEAEAKRRGENWVGSAGS